MNLTKIMFAAGVALAATTAQAETLASYRGQLSSSDTLTVIVTDKPANPSLCRAFEQPLQADAYLTWTGVTETTTYFAGGCWSTTSDGRISLAMRASSDGRPIDLILEPKDFLRKPGVPFALWPTANETTLERAPERSSAQAYPGVLGFFREKEPILGLDVAVLLMERPVASCLGQPGHEAALLITPPNGGEVEVNKGCWRRNGDQFTYVGNEKTARGEPLSMSFDTSKFTLYERFYRLAAR